MAKLSFTKLGLKINNDIKLVQYNNNNIEIKQYLPIEEKMELITAVINSSIDENQFFNPVKIELYYFLEIIDRYTNITFTEKQYQDPCKLYNFFISNNMDKLILDNIDEHELIVLRESLNKCIMSYENYRQSMLGVMESMQQNYDVSQMDINNLTQDLKGLDLSLLGDIVKKFDTNQN